MQYMYMCVYTHTHRAILRSGYTDLSFILIPFFLYFMRVDNFQRIATVILSLFSSLGSPKGESINNCSLKLFNYIVWFLLGASQAAKWLRIHLSM